MTTGELLVLALFGIGLVLSLALLFGLIRVLRREKKDAGPGRRQAGKH